MLVIELIICVLLPLPVWSWVVYPLFMISLAKRGADPRRTGHQPPVTVLIAAHNEEADIGARLKNLLEQDYKGGLTVLLGVDGCTDRTASIANEVAKENSGIHVVVSAGRRGKAGILKMLVAKASDPVLVFTDANTRFRPDAITRLVSRFDGPQTGGVCGRLLLRDKSGRATPESSYWDLENRLKLAESNIDSCLGANGAIYAIRRELFPEDLPDNTIIDDFVIGMRVREKGVRFVYEPEAVAEEDLPAIGHEWARRVRIGSGDLQALVLCRRCLSPAYGIFALMFWSHKVLRWMTPVLSIVIAGLAVADLLIAKCLCPVDAFVFAAALLLLLGALAGRAGLRSAIPSACDHFVTMQIALLWGYFKLLAGGARGHWQRTPR